MSADQPLYLRSLTHINFRNLKSGSLPWSKGLNIILGQNSSGKTNVLEAIYFLATAKSFRTNSLKNMIQNGQAAAKVEGHGAGEQGCHLAVSYDGGGRETMLNGKVVRVAEYVGHLPVIFYSTASLKNIEGYPAERRRLLDRGIFLIERGYLQVLKTYRHILRQKRRLLRAGDAQNRQRQLRAWNQELASHGSDIIETRRRYVERLNRTVGSVYLRLTGWEKAISLHYRTPFNVQSREKFLQAVHEHEREEREGTPCLVGPHRDDLDILVNDQPMKAFASTGEKRLFLLALALAQREISRSTRGAAPILLLDDINAELDRERIERTLSLFRKNGQAFITSTDGDLLLEHGKPYVLKEGAIHAQ